MKRFYLIICVFTIISATLFGCVNKNNLNINNKLNEANNPASDSNQSNKNKEDINESSKYDKDFSFDCTNENEAIYETLIYGYSDSIPSAKHKIEYEFADLEKYKNQTIKPSVEISINGKKHLGNYLSTQYSGYNYFPSYTYLDDNGNIFDVDENGVLTSFFGGKSSSKGKILTKDECVQIAKIFMCNLVNIESYDIGITDEKEQERYKITFTKYVKGLKSTDSATITVQYDGTLYSYSSFMLGRVDSSAIVDKVNINGATASAKEKLDEIYKDSKNYYDNITYGEPYVLITVLKDGSTALIYSVDIKCSDILGEFEAIVSERVNLVVVIE